MKQIVIEHGPYIFGIAIVAGLLVAIVAAVIWREKHPDPEPVVAKSKKR